MFMSTCVYGCITLLSWILLCLFFCRCSTLCFLRLLSFLFFFPSPFSTSWSILPPVFFLLSFSVSPRSLVALPGHAWPRYVIFSPSPTSKWTNMNKYVWAERDSNLGPLSPRLTSGSCRLLHHSFLVTPGTHLLHNSRPDMTSAVDWALKANYLSILHNTAASRSMTQFRPTWTEVGTVYF